MARGTKTSKKSKRKTSKSAPLSLREAKECVSRPLCRKVRKKHKVTCQQKTTISGSIISGNTVMLGVFQTNYILL